MEIFFLSIIENENNFKARMTKTFFNEIWKDSKDF